jgi:hypothetical protein
MNSRIRLCLSLTALVAGSIGCRTPTEAFIDITTDGACHDVAETGITVGLIGDIESKDYGAKTQACEKDGTIGSIVLFPDEGDKEAPFAFKVVTSLGADVAECVAPDYGPNCIVARRAMRFVPHEPFHVPVRMTVACAGVTCPEDQTCFDGTCHTATVDPGDCDKSSTCTPPGDVPPAFQRSAGGPGVQMARHVAASNDGTLAITGNFQNDLDLGLDSGPLMSAGDLDIFVATYAQGGALRWARSFGGGGSDEGASVAIDGTGAVYVLATFMKTVDFGGGPLTSNGSTDIALVKLTPFGKLAWAVSFGGVEGDDGGKVAVSPDDGTVYVGGSFAGSMSIGKQTLESAGGRDGFVASFTSSGDLRWAKALGGTSDDAGGPVAVDDAGDVYVGGYFNGHAAIDPAMPFDSQGAGDIFIAKLSSSGKLLWAKAIGSKGSDVAVDLAAGKGRVAVTGTLGGSLTIDGAPVAANGGDGFVAWLQPTGKVAWAQAFGATGGTNQGSGVAFADDGSLVVGGVIAKGSAFGSEPIGNDGTRNPFLAVLEPDGSSRWAKGYASAPLTAGMPAYAETTGIAATNHGFAYVAGWFTGKLTVDDKELKSGGAEDMFLLRVAPP